MTRGKGKKILSIAEREGLIGDKKELAAELQNSEFGAGTVAASMNKELIKKQIAHLDKELHDGSAPKVSGSKRDSLASEAAELRERIKEGLPTRFEMDHPAKAPGAIGKHMNWDKRTMADRMRYREIQRILEPNDPTAVDVEKFRRDR